MITTTKNSDNSNTDMTWKVVQTGKSTTPLRKANQHRYGKPSGIEREQPMCKNGSEQDDGGCKAQGNSRTLEVRFMIDPTKRDSFNLCMQFREFITEAQAMDSIF
jgi:hypothetical protein